MCKGLCYIGFRGMNDTVWLLYVRWHSTSSVGGHHWNHQADVRTQLCQLYHQCFCKVTQLFFPCSEYQSSFYPTPLTLSFILFYIIQILAGRLSTHGGGSDLCQFALPRADVRPIYG